MYFAEQKISVSGDNELFIHSVTKQVAVGVALINLT